MGMDLVAIIEHKKTPKEILEIPEILSSSNDLIDLFINKHPSSKIKESKWNGSYKMTEENIVKIWKLLESDEDIQIENFNYCVEIESFFGDITINKNTITISPFPEHKYGNLRNPVSSKYVFMLHREIAKLFDANKILYCVDSYCESYILEEKSRNGWTLNQIINLGNKLFGKPPKEINEAIENLYFIDEFDIKLDELNPQKKVWSRYIHEYEQSKKKKKTDI